MASDTGASDSGVTDSGVTVNGFSVKTQAGETDSGVTVNGFSVKTQAGEPLLHDDCGKEASTESNGAEKAGDPENSRDEKGAVSHSKQCYTPPSWYSKQCSRYCAHVTVRNTSCDHSHAAGDNDIRALIEKCETDDVFETLPLSGPEPGPQEKELVVSQAAKERKRSVAFNMTDFTAKREKNSQYSCPSFYTGPEGYHISVKVGTNSEGEMDAESCLSLYACILKGEHDDQLSWPFVGQITVTLVNQIEDKNHAHMVVKIEETDNVQVDSSWGISSFIKHARLDFDPHTNTQYLKDDTLHFRVCVEVDP